MHRSHEWRARTSQRVMVDIRSIRVGVVVQKTGETVTLRPVASGVEWECPSVAARPATPDEVAAALAGE